MRCYKNVTLAAFMICTLLFASACGGDNGGSTAAGDQTECDGGNAQAAVLPHFQDPLTAQYVAGAEAAAADCGVDIRTAGPPQIDPPAHIRQFNDVIAAGANALVTVAYPPELWVKAIDRAVEGGAQVATVNVASPSSQELVHVEANPIEAGRALGESVVEALGPDASGTIVSGICIPGIPLLEQNLAGFRDVVESELPDVQVTDPVGVGFEPAENFNNWQRLMSQNSDAVAAVGICVGDVTSLLKVQSEQNADWKIIGADLREESLNGVVDGNVIALIDRQPFFDGYTAMRAVLESVGGADVPNGWIETPTTIVTQENAQDAIERESAGTDDPEVFRTYFEPQISEIFGDLPAAVKPMAEYNKTQTLK